MIALARFSARTPTESAWDLAAKTYALGASRCDRYFAEFAGDRFVCWRNETKITASVVPINEGHDNQRRKAESIEHESDAVGAEPGQHARKILAVKGSRALAASQQQICVLLARFPLNPRLSRVTVGRAGERRSSANFA